MKKKVLFFILVIFININVVYAINTSAEEYSDLYKEWLLLDEKDRKKVPEPPKFVKEFIPKVTFYNDYEPFAKSSAVDESTYDLRNVDGISYVTNVKNQGQTNLCWSFASNGALESNILINSNGEEEYNFNSLHTSNALAYSFSDYYNPYGSKEINTGGNFDDSLKYWTSGIGPVESFKGNGTQELSASNTILNSTNVKIDEAYMLPYFDLNTQTVEAHSQFIKLIKQQIVENGAVEFYSASPQSAKGETITLSDGTTYNCTNPYNKSYYSVYTDNENDYLCSAHAMLIVGWDDNFSKDNFNVGSETNEGPRNNGAWIVKNSWGTSSNKNGYVYYSYEDYNLNRWIEVVSSTSTKNYDNIYQYNPTGDGFWYYSSSIGGGIIFDKTKDIEILNEISMYLIPTNTNNYINYKVYINRTDGNLENMELITYGKIDNNYSGYYTIKLNKDIELTGEQFAVKIILENATVGSTEQANMNFANQESLGIIENQSYLYFSDDYYEDTHNSGSSVFIKAFTTKKNTSTDKTPIINTVLKNNEIEYPISNQKITLKSITNNIDNASLLSYKIYDGNEVDVTNNFNIENGLIISNLGISVLQLTPNVKEDLYTIKTLYNNEVLDEDILDLRSSFIEIKNVKNQEIYSKNGGVFSATLNTVGITDDINLSIKNSKGEDVTDIFSIEKNINENEINILVEAFANTQYDIYTIDFSIEDEVLMGIEFIVYDVIFKYNNNALDYIKLLNNDTIEISTNILPTNSNLNLSMRIDNATIASIENNLIKALKIGNTNIIATINNQEIKMPLTIIDEPYFVYDKFSVISNVLGNQEIDNCFGGNIDASVSYYNINDIMTIEKSVVDENNIESNCFNTTFVNDVEKDIININIEPKNNCLENNTIIPGLYKISLKVNINDTKNSKIINYKNINIIDYIALETITSNVEKINLKTGDTYNLKDNINLNFEPIDATNKNVKYVDYNTEIININDEGIITALKGGITTLKIQSEYNEAVYDTINVMVNPNIKNITTSINSNYNNKLYYGYGGKVTANITTENIIDNEKLTIAYYKDNVKQNDMSNIFDTTNRLISNNNTTIDLYVGPSLAVGKYKIELSYNNADTKYFEFEVIEPKKVTSIEAEDITLSNDGTLTNINYQIKPSDAFNKNVDFELADSTIATIENGKIKGLKEGKTTLTIKSTDGSNIEKTVNVSVVEKSIVIDNIKLENDIIYETIGGKLNFRISLINIDSNKVNLEIIGEDNDIVYNEEVELNEKGYKDVELNISKTIPAGTYTIKATIGNFEKSETFVVSSYKAVENIKFMYNQKELSKLVLLNEDEIKITSVITNEDTTFKDISYSVKDTTIARITDEGLIYGVKVGNTELIASVGFQTFTLPIEITNNSGVNYGTLNIHSNVTGNNMIDNHYGGKYTVEAIFDDINENKEITLKNIFLKNSNISQFGTFEFKANEIKDNKSILEVTFTEYQSTPGLNSGIFNASGGTYIISYNYTINDTKETKLTSSFGIDLKDYIELTKINLSKTDIKLDINESINISSLINFEPSDATNKNVKYEVSNSNMLKLNGSTITGLNEGTAKITVISQDNDNIKASINVTVEKNEYLNFENNINIHNENGTKYLKGFKVNNTYRTLLNSIDTNLDITLKDSNGTKITSKLSLLKTGMKLNIGNNKYDIVIKGDMSGDGKMSITDLSQMRYHLAKVKGKEKTGAYKQAGDMNDKDGITITDLSQMRKNLAGVN